MSEPAEHPRFLSMAIASSRVFRFALLATLWSLLDLRAQPGSDQGASSPRPNIILIVVNSLRWDETGYAGHPFLQTPHLDRLAREGAHFESAFVSTPDPAASFAGLLTGRHPAGAAPTALRDNAAGRTLPQSLRDAGYRTFFAGRWPLPAEAPERVGFGAWVNSESGYVDPPLRTNRGTETGSGYLTDVLTARVLEFIKPQSAAPFCVVLGQPALQGATDGSTRVIAADRHRGLYANDVPRRRPGPEVFGDPRAAHTSKLPANGAASDEEIRTRWRALAAIDEGIGRIYEALHASGQLDRTVIIVTGDRGFLYGEHGVSGPGRTAHEESIRIPLLLRYPPAVKRGAAPGQLVLNIDLAPTLLQLAGLAVPAVVAPASGMSLVGLFTGKPTAWRFSFLVEGIAVPPGGTQPERYQAVRTPAWKYMRYMDGSGAEELYDHHADHYELVNLAGRSTAKNELRRWSAELAKVLKPAK